VEVHPYSNQRLVELLSREGGGDPGVIGLKAHVDYFSTYFAALHASTIVVEDGYIDRYFLEDFAGYYVRCSRPYKRECLRLHFFSHQFNQATFRAVLEGNTTQLSHQTLARTYLGFVVVKPLPKTMVGRTCLKTYKGGRRTFPITREYKVNLFGIPLSVRTLAFQEQDSVAAACATSSLWSAFHGTGRLFHHAIPSPHEITRRATETLPANTRNFPNYGLSYEQMAQAIRSVGLEPYLVGAGDHIMLKRTLYAYLSASIPVILGIRLYHQMQFNGKHAVTATGFRLSPAIHQAQGFVLNADRMIRVYVHDDQVGPFARMLFEVGQILDRNNNPINVDCLSTSFGGPSQPHIAVAENLLIPLMDMIRIPFKLVHDTTLMFHVVIVWLMSVSNLQGLNLIWDIKLRTVSEFKLGLLKDPAISPATKRRAVLDSLPCFVWIVTLKNGDNNLVDFVFDTTDLEQGRLLLSHVPYDDAFFAWLRAGCDFANTDPAADPLRTEKVWSIVDYIRNT
jgi:hypothetical protein